MYNLFKTVVSKTLLMGGVVAKRFFNTKSAIQQFEIFKANSLMLLREFKALIRLDQRCTKQDFYNIQNALFYETDARILVCKRMRIRFLILNDEMWGIE